MFSIAEYYLCLMSALMEIKYYLLTYLPKLFIDDWNFIGEPATDMDCIDLVKVVKGLDLRLKKALA